MIVSKLNKNILFNHRFIYDGPKGPKEDMKPEGEKREEKAGIETKISDETKAKLAQKGEEKAQETTETPAGKVHQTYFEKIKAEPEETAEKYRDTLGVTDIKTIRFNTRLLKGEAKKGEKEDDETVAGSIKEETQKRIHSYTSKFDGQWYTLDYQRIDDKRVKSKGPTISHENNIGLGDILLDPDIKEILVKRGGELIKAHKGVVPTRKMYAGRQAFLDENNNYVYTHTGDTFRILSNEESNLKDPKALKKYLGEFKADEKVRQENMKNFDNDMKALEDQDVYYTDAVLDPNKSVVEQIKISMSSGQKANAKIIENVFKEEMQGKGLSDEAIAKITAAAIVNAYKESGLSATVIGDHGKSVGLFQLHINGGGHDMSVEERQDPATNARTILKREILAGYGSHLRARASSGASVTELAAIFSRDIERPADKYGAMQARSKFALKMFGERKSSNENEIAERIDNGKPGYNGKGILKLRSNQSTWIFGSSGAVALNNARDGLKRNGIDGFDSEKVGFFGIVGISPEKFLEKLHREMPRISKLNPKPKQIVIVGLAANGLGSNTDAAVDRNIRIYGEIKEYLESQCSGTQVKFATVQPAQGMGDQINRFNEKLRQKYTDKPGTVLDIARKTTTADGIHIKPEYASSDGIHLSHKGYQTLAKLIKEGEDNGRTA